MESKKCCKSSESQRKTVDDNIKAADKYSGVAINIADNDKVNPQMVKEQTKSLNNNPRSDE